MQTRITDGRDRETSHAKTERSQVEEVWFAGPQVVVFVKQ